MTGFKEQHMANRIKGITIEIGGDTTKLDKALSGTNKEIGETQKALKDVERLLKMDPEIQNCWSKNRDCLPRV